MNSIKKIYTYQELLKYSKNLDQKIRYVETCTIKTILRNKNFIDLFNELSSKIKVQIEFPPLRENNFNDLNYFYKKLENIFNISFIVNDFGLLNFFKNKSITVGMGRVFAKSVNKFPFEQIVPSNNLMTFDIISKIFIDEIVNIPYLNEKTIKILNKFNIKFIDIDFNQYLSLSNVNSFKDFIFYVHRDDTFMAHSNFCINKKVYNTCNKSKCVLNSDSFKYTYINKENKIVEIDIEFIYRGECIYYKNTIIKKEPLKNNNVVFLV